MKKVLIAVLAPALLAAPVALAQATEEPSAQPARPSAAEFIEKAATGGMFEVLSSDLALKATPTLRRACFPGIASDSAIRPPVAT